MTASSLRRRCKARLQALDLRPPVEAETLITTLQRERGRRIRVLALPEDLEADAPCGLWIAYAEDDVVLIEQATSPMHRQHILFHELAHIACGHAQSGATSAALPRLFTRLDATTVRSVLGRPATTSTRSVRRSCSLR